LTWPTPVVTRRADPVVTARPDTGIGDTEPTPGDTELTPVVTPSPTPS
jgi:hypothetical protein